MTLMTLTLMILRHHKTQRKDKKHGKNSRKEGALMQIVLKTHYRRKKVREKYCGFKIKL
jgi:hypothetical protein